MKKQERVKRFGTKDDNSAAGPAGEELDTKKKARMERFGEAQVTEAQRSVT